MPEQNTKPYIVKNAAGEEFLLPTYPQTFRALMDDKETIRDFLNSILELDRDHEIVDLTYEFEKYIDVFMPGDKPMKLDVWVTTRDKRFVNIELQNRQHPFFLDRMQLYNSYLMLRSKHDYNNSDMFLAFSKEEQKMRYYELPETVSIWLCNFGILRPEDIYKDTWTVYSEDDIKNNRALPVFPKNRYIVVDLLKFAKLRKRVNTHEDFWLRLISKGPVEIDEVDDPLFAKALDRLRVSHVKPELIKNLEGTMFDEHAEEAIRAEEYLKAVALGKAEGMAKGIAEGRAEGIAKGRAEGIAKGRAEGIAKGRAEGEAIGEAINAKRVDFLRSKGIPEELISAMLAIK